MTAIRLTTAQHTRRTFLGVTGLLAGAAAVGALGMGTRVAAHEATSEGLLGDLDLPEFNLANYAKHVRKYTTAWGATVDDWAAAFQAVNADLTVKGGGRLIVPPGEYPISKYIVFDLPAGVSVHLRAGSHIEMVGERDGFVGSPLAFWGNVKPGEPTSNRIQREFAAVLGPGSIGYPKDQLHRYPHENGVGMMYMKTALMDGVQVPHVPGKGLTAQFGCDKIIIRNCTIGTTFTGDVELDYRGQSSIVAQGGWSFTQTPPEWPLFTEVVIENNTIHGYSVRGIHADFSAKATVRGNKLTSSWGGALILRVVGDATVADNDFGAPCQGLPRLPTGIPFPEYVEVHKDGVAESALSLSVRTGQVTGNTLRGHSHRHCVHSWENPSYQKAGVIHARNNRWSKGTDTIFGGAPMWDSDS